MLLLVRHSAPEVDPEAPAEDWPLSEEGRRRCGPADLPDPAVVDSHGTVISRYVAARTGRDPLELWRALELPDVVEV